MHIMNHKLNLIVTIVLAFCLLISNCQQVRANSKDSVDLVYITDLNLYPTPSTNELSLHDLEKQSGILVYESQTILQEIVNKLNKEIKPDVVIFQGNNVAPSNNQKYLWQLFLDIIDEINAEVLIALGTNEIQSYDLDYLIKSFPTIKASTNPWYSYKLKNYLFVQLDAVSLLNNPLLAKKQILWLEKLLKEHSQNLTIISIHHALLDEKSQLVAAKYLNKLYQLIKDNPQVKLVLGGGNYLNRSKIVDNALYVTSSSLAMYPCVFKRFTISQKKIKIKTLFLSMKGIVNKAKESILASKLAVNWSINTAKNPLKSLKKHVFDKKANFHFKYVSPKLK